MTTVIGHIEGHYEMRSMPYGQAYVWCPNVSWLGATAVRY